MSILKRTNPESGWHLTQALDDARIGYSMGHVVQQQMETVRSPSSSKRMTLAVYNICTEFLDVGSDERKQYISNTEGPAIADRQLANAGRIATIGGPRGARAPFTSGSPGT